MANKPVVGNYDISQLERLVFFYPWYSYARVKLVEKLAAADTGSAEQKAREDSAYYPSMCRIYDILENKTANDAPEEGNVIDFVAISPAARENEPQYILAGADYFSPEELRSVGESDFKPGRGDALPVSSDFMDETSIPEFDLSDFYTETLARIYAEQGYYDEAIKVYAKLILLYPEKSAYFATLVDEIKLKKS